MSEEFDYLFEDLDVTTLTEEDIIDLIEKKIPSSRRAKIARAIADRLPPGRTSSQLRLYALERDLEKQKNRKFTKADSHQGITSAPRTEMRTFQDFMTIVEDISEKTSKGLTDLQRRRYLGRKPGESRERLNRANKRKDMKAALASMERQYKGMKSGIYSSYEPEGETTEAVDWDQSEIGHTTGGPVPKKKMSAKKRYEFEKKRRENLAKKPGDPAGDSTLIKALRRRAQETGNYAN